MAYRPRPSGPGEECQQGRSVIAYRCGSRPRYPAGKYNAVCCRVTGEQCFAVGGARDGKIQSGVHASLDALRIVELQREDLPSVGRLLALLRGARQRFILFCDDLSFGHDDAHYKSLKAVLDGGIEGRPDNVVLYATSNRRHLMPRDMIENERGSAINPAEAVEEKVSLSDRFGLWLGFHPCDQDQYLSMIRGYCDAYGVKVEPDTLRAEAIEWQATRGARSGRVAWQYFVDLAGRHGVTL